MTIKSYFFDDSNGDRKFGAKEVAKYFNQFVLNGVFFDKYNSLLVMPTGGNSVKVLPGTGFVNGYFLLNDEEYEVSVPSTTQERIDRIVVRCTLGSERAIDIVRIEGVTSTTPQPPNIVRNDTVFDLCLAEVKVKSSDTEVKQENITDTRFDRDICGLVSSLLGRPDAYSTMSVMIDEFDVWFSDMQSKINSNVLDSLDTQIQDVRYDGILAEMATSNLEFYLNDYRTDNPNIYTNLTLASGIQPYSTSFTPKYTRIGKFINIQGAVTGITGPNTNVLSIITDYAPSRDVYFTGITTNLSGKARLCSWLLRTNGTLTMGYTDDGLFDVTENTFWHFDFTYPLQTV